jgi:hypothetical protein
MGRIMGRADVMMEEFAERINKLARLNLGATYTAKNHEGRTYRKRIDSSGKLKNSLGFKIDTRGEDGKFTKANLTFEMLQYGIYVDRGRKAGKGIPMNPLINWIKKKPLRIRDMKTGAFITATDSRVKSLAYLISRKAKMKGIKPTNFFSEPFNDEFPKFTQRMAEAVSEEYIEDIDERVNNINLKSKNTKQ